MSFVQCKQGNGVQILLEVEETQVRANATLSPDRAVYDIVKNTISF